MVYKLSGLILALCMIFSYAQEARGSISAAIAGIAILSAKLIDWHRDNVRTREAEKLRKSNEELRRQRDDFAKELHENLGEKRSGNLKKLQGRPTDKE